MKDIFCPSCRHHLNDASCVTGGNFQPSPGDISACLYCGQALEYLQGDDVRAMSAEEFQKLAEDERIALSGAMAVSAIYRAKYGKKSSA